MLCDFAQAFPTFVGKFLDYEWGLRRRLREETVTDMWVASMAALRGLGVYVDLADEMETGADLEIWFLSSDRKRGVGFVIQAKRSHCGPVQTCPACKLKWERHRFEELDHAAGANRPAGSQARDLTHSAQRSRRSVYPLYAFYTPGHIWEKTGRIKPIMLADAHEVRRRIVLGRRDAWRTRNRGNAQGKIRRGKAEFRALERLADLMFPLARMFCFEPWAPIKQVADTGDLLQSFMLVLSGEHVGVALVPQPEEVARSVSAAIRAARRQDVVASLPLPALTFAVPEDIRQLASGGAGSGDASRPDVPVSRRRIAFVATSLVAEASSTEPPTSHHDETRG